MKSMSEALRLRLPRSGESSASERATIAGTPKGGEPPRPGGLEPTLARFIFKYSWKQQLLPLVLTAISFPFLYYSYDLPKTIVNRAIGGKNFPQSFLGFEFEQFPYLSVLCAIFLALVFINGGFKYYINVLKGRLGERMLRRLRFELYHRLLRFPIGQFKKVNPGELIPMVTSEVEQLGGYIGDAIVTPIFQGGQLITTIVFMFIQDPVLGLAAVSLYPVQGYLIPKLQRKVNQLGKTRVRQIRQVADRIGESAAGIAELHSNDAVRLQLASFTQMMGRIYEIRFEVYQRKFFVKFLNNFLGQLTPFFFYAIGGYLVIRGSLSFGALVAVLAAYKDLAGPWNELLTQYQLQETARITYDQVVEQFDPAGLIDAKLQLDPPDAIPSLAGEVALANLTFAEDERVRLLDGVNATFPVTTHLAIVGQSSSGKHELGLLLARLMSPTAGRVTIGGVDIAGLHNAVVGRRIGYASSTPYIFAGTLRDNIFLGLKNRPMRARPGDESRARKAAALLAEARASGNLELDPEADWLDYEAAGVADEAELATRCVELLRRVDLDEDVYGFGLRGRINPHQRPDVADRLLEARHALAQCLEEDAITHLVEPFDPEKYNTNASLAENLLFGTPVGPAFDIDQLAQNTVVLKVLDKVGLVDDLVAMGGEVAQTMIELFADLPPDHEFFEQYSFIGAGELPDYQAILGRLGKAGQGVKNAPVEAGAAPALKAEDRTKLLSLPFKLIAARHRLGLMDEKLMARILEARKVFAADLPESLRGQIEFFDTARYNAAATVQDNVLFGKVAYGEAAAQTRVPALISEVLDDLGLRDAITAIGLDFSVGSAGSRLSLAQRQKAAVARALLKRPDLVILNEATTALDGPTQAKVMGGVREECVGRGLVFLLHRVSLARPFERVFVMSEGRLVEQGTFEELDRPGTVLKTLLQAE
jgi:putative ABC transport system ATP-binding protein